MRDCSIRASPIYTPILTGPRSADALMFTDNRLSRADYVGWYGYLPSLLLTLLLFRKRVQALEGLGLTFDLWDVERYRGVSADSPTEPHWVGR